MKLKNRYWGSTTALAVGWICLFGGIAQMQQYIGLFLVGVTTVFTSMAYRSAKRSKLGAVTPSAARGVGEAIALVLAVAPILIQGDLFSRVYNDPVPNLVVPLWGFIAYAAAKLSSSAPARSDVSSATPAVSSTGSSPGLRQKATLYQGGGIVLMALVYGLGQSLFSAGAHAWLLYIGFAAAVASWLYGCMLSASARGYHRAVGLLGLLTLPGLLILALLPDRTKRSE